jgi:hypothetical protein
VRESTFAPASGGRSLPGIVATHANVPGGTDMPNMSAEDLAEHLRLLAIATSEDLDEMLEDLLVRAYPTRANQDG